MNSEAKSKCIITMTQIGENRIPNQGSILTNNHSSVVNYSVPELYYDIKELFEKFDISRKN